MGTTTVQGLLVEWARWHRTNSGEVVGYPSRTAFDRLRGSSLPSAMITDDDASAVDAAVARLGARCPDQAQVLREYYLHRRSLAAVARAHATDRRNVARTLACAETAVEWILDPSGGIEENY